jgi:hypothetical protein
MDGMAVARFFATSAYLTAVLTVSMLPRDIAHRDGCATPWITIPPE